MSTLLTLLDRSLVPPGGFAYTDKDTRNRIVAGDLQGLVRLATQHRVINGFEVPDNFAAIIEDDICRRIPLALVRPSPNAVTRYIGSTSEITGKTDALMRAAKRNGGKMLCETREAESRGMKCLACPMNARTMCPSCNGVLDWLKINWHLPSFSFDPRLYVCRLNGILNKAQIHLAGPVLVSLAGKKSLSAMPDNCWKPALVKETES